MSFYDSYPHIGYDINGKKIMRPATKDALDALLDSIEVPKGWTGLTDIHTGNPLNLKYAFHRLLWVVYALWDTFTDCHVAVTRSWSLFVVSRWV